MSALDQAFIKAFEKKTGSTATPETPPAPLMPSAGPTPIAPSPRKRRVLPPAPPRDNPIDEGYADGAWYRLDHPAEDNQRNPAAHESPSEPTSSLPPIAPPAAHASAPVAPQAPPAPLPTVPVGDPSNVEPATAPSDLATNVAEANYVASALKLPPIHQSIPSPPTGPPTAPAATRPTEQPTQPAASPMPAALTDEEIAQLLAVDATPMVCLPDYDPAALANLPMMVEATLPEYELPEQALPAPESSKPEASKPESSKAAPAAAKSAPDSADVESDESAGDAELDAGASSVVKKRLSKKAKAAREQRRAAAEARRQAREAKSREASQQPAKSGEVKSDEAKPRNAEQPASSGNDDRDVVRLSDETPITISLEKLRLAIANSIASTQPAGVQPQTPATQSSEASQPAAKSATPIVVEVPTAVSTTTPVIESPTSVAVKPAEVNDKPTSPEATQTKTNSPATDASPASKPEAGISEPTATAPAAALKIETKPEATIEPPAPVDCDSTNRSESTNRRCTEVDSIGQSGSGAQYATGAEITNGR
ncbi:MAG: hypothetical protein R3C99_21555 [Pirellulaceae bacterium]